MIRRPSGATNEDAFTLTGIRNEVRQIAPEILNSKVAVADAPAADTPIAFRRQDWL